MANEKIKYIKFKPPGQTTEKTYDIHVDVANVDGLLDGANKIQSTYLPSYIDDIVEGYFYNNKFYKESGHSTLITGEAGKIYVDITSGKENPVYRWSGTAYIEIVDVPDLTKYYTKTETDSLVWITTEDIDVICSSTI